MDAANYIDESTVFLTLNDNGEAVSVQSESGTDGIEEAFPIGGLIANRYRILSLLGSGGMGKVFLSLDTDLDRQVVLKVLNWEKKHNVTSTDLLLHEARLNAALLHPGIATVFDFGKHLNHPYIVFEYVEGKTLRELLIARKTLTPEEVSLVLRPLAEAIDFAHARGIIHRDLKPENICFAPNGEPKILDFGLAQQLAKAVGTGKYSGTAAYSSPEQVMGEVTDGRADQYSLAVIAYELLVGRPCFGGKKAIHVLRQHLNEPPPSLSHQATPNYQAIERVLHRALRKAPEARYSSCGAFAKAFAEAAELGTSTRPIPLFTSPNRRVSVCISHMGEDSLTACVLANGLKKFGYSAWCFHRDALPGISNSQQQDEAIDSAYSSILLISKSSLTNRDFEREVRITAKKEKPILPVLVDISSYELQMQPPSWFALLGSASAISWERNNPDNTLNRIKSSLELHQIPAVPNLATPQPRTTRNGSHLWATDANQIDIEELANVVYYNEIVRDYMNQRNKYFISGTKGLGKTLLLSLKRYKLSQEYEAQPKQQPLCLVPQSHPFLDFMSELRDLSRQYEDLLGDLKTAKRFWMMALRISAISQHRGLLNPEDSLNLSPFPEGIRNWLLGDRMDPTLVFKELLHISPNKLNRLLNDSDTFLDRTFRRIHSATYFFIDKVDQAISQFGTAMWIHLQAGLIEAAWELMNANRHVRIFCTIRQEAFVSYHSDTKANLYSATSILRYTPEQLEEMMDQLAREYEGCDNFKEFTRLNMIRNPYRNMPEDAFQYLRRHTFGRPRDLVVLASTLSANQDQLSETNYCHLVSQTSTSGLVTGIFGEMRAFLQCLHDPETRYAFLERITSNILSRQEAEKISAEFNGLTAADLSYYTETHQDLNHPFRDLYMTGLLGVLVRDTRSDRIYQRFRQPEDLIIDIAKTLPESTHYFIHPALQSLLLQHRSSRLQHLHQHIMIGESATWDRIDEVTWHIERALNQTQSQPVRDAVRELLRLRRQLSLASADYRRQKQWESHQAWIKVKELLHQNHLDSILFWCDELLKDL